MASLTITAVYSKKILFGFSVFLGSLLLLLIVFAFGKSIFEMVFPPKPVPALVAFGKLPELSMAEGFLPPKNITYKIDTVSGELKELKTKLKVFAIDVSSAPKFGDLASSNSKAQRAQFALPPSSVVNYVATYTDLTNKSKILTINTISGDMSFKSDYINNADIISRQIKDEDSAKSVAQTFLSAFGLDLAAYPKEKITTTRFKIDSSKLTEANIGSSANLVQVTFNRGDLDTIPVVYPSAKKPKVTALVSTTNAVSATANFSKIQEYFFSTYPLKGINKAFADLQDGKSIYNMEFEGSEFSIRDVTLAYLDTDTQQAFLEPVYVFIGNDGLVAYVSAVSEAWIKTKPN